MNSKYTAPEVITVGNADELILGAKETLSMDEGFPAPQPDSDLDN